MILFNSVRNSGCLFTPDNQNISRQPKIMIWLSSGQPKLKSCFISIVWSNQSNFIVHKFTKISTHSHHWSEVGVSDWDSLYIYRQPKSWRTTRNYNLVVRGAKCFIFLIQTLLFNNVFSIMFMMLLICVHPKIDFFLDWWHITKAYCYYCLLFLRFHLVCTWTMRTLMSASMTAVKCLY